MPKSACLQHAAGKGRADVDLSVDAWSKKIEADFSLHAKRESAIRFAREVNTGSHFLV
jgi:hypothetical protein